LGRGNRRRIEYCKGRRREEEKRMGGEEEMVGKEGE
jgi:hypothetical protein